MAIKTKKISDLSSISSTGSYLLGINLGTTGKISYEDIMNDVENRIDIKLASYSQDDSNKTSEGQTFSLRGQVVSVSDTMILVGDKLDALDGRVNDVVSAVKTIDKRLQEHITLHDETVLRLQNMIGELEMKVEALQEKLKNS